MRWIPRLLALSATLVLSACALDAGDPSAATFDDELKATKVCSTQHDGKTADGDAVTICDKTYPTLPFVRPPADQTSGKTATLYVGISDMMEGGRFVTRDGKSYALTDSNGKIVSLDATSSSAIAKSLRMPSNRNLYLVYRVTGEIGTAIDPTFKTKIDAIKVTEAKPAILIAGRAIDTAQTYGAWEGTVAARTGDSSFDPNKRVRIRVSFSSVGSTASHFAVWSTSSQLKDGANYLVKGTVENFSKAVRSDDGTCIPSLASLGAASPFAGASSGSVSLTRIGGMHFPGDDEHVLTMPSGAKGWSVTAMGSFGRFLPADFLSTEPGSGSMTPHGTPTGAGIELSAVTGGGGGC